MRAPGADVEVIDTKPRAPPPDPRPHLSVGLSRNFDLGNDAINRLAYVAERSSTGWASSAPRICMGTRPG